MRKLPRRGRARHSSPGGSHGDTIDLAWDTSQGGVPGLAYDTEFTSCSDYGWTDFATGPNGEPVEQVNYNGAAYTPSFYYQDFQGNTRVLLDSSGNLSSSLNEPAWGQPATSFGSSGGPTPLQYQGTYTDPWTGMVYDQVRWYDPATGQFMSQDPIVNLTMQAYEYAGGNPIASSDPTGMMRVCGYPCWASPAWPTKLLGPHANSPSCGSNVTTCMIAPIIPAGGENAPKSWSDKAKNLTEWGKWLRTYIKRAGGNALFDKIVGVTESGEEVWVEVYGANKHIFDPGHLIRFYKEFGSIQGLLDAVNQVEAGTLDVQRLTPGAEDTLTGWELQWGTRARLFLKESGLFERTITPAGGGSAYKVLISKCDLFSLYR